MAARTAWVLNLDADLELGAGPRYAPTRAVVEAMKAHAARLTVWLVAPGDLVVDDASPAGVARACVGRAFCPTPRAVALLARAGADPEPHPPRAVLRVVNSRAFAASLGQTLPGAAFVTTLDDALDLLREAPPVGDAWRMKRLFGMAGRGQRRAAAPPSDADIAFVKAGLSEGGLQIEPNVRIVTELALHGMLAPGGAVSLGALVQQTCDAHGAWLSSERVIEATPLGDAPARLDEEAQRVALALAREAYFGPFGLDAYLYEGAGGALHLQPRSEINARYSMGYAVGMGVGASRRP